ncbi:twist-related protein-like [Diprion similis]|uniref:twist-related protein-like n=1 Tax=Diprion similis TaxID=362088 RepID=UPI001EF95850|nr:twist-related protein-like [Diprion similis]XP_046738869.1 twist-related protein-like [Diprion similis]
MPRKRRTSTVSLQDIEDDDFCSEEKYGGGSSRGHIQDAMEGVRAPRNAANARERARMRVLSKAFCRLKTTLPWVPADTKLSKLDTLRLAATYIAHLRAVLRDEGESHPETTRSLSLALSWPFAIQGTGAPMLMNNNCTSGSSSTSSSPGGQYRNQQSPLDVQPNVHNHHHHHNHQPIHVRHNHEPQLPYY